MRQGKKAGVIMWPGCSTTFNDLKPSFTVPFSEAMTFDEKTDITLDWLDLPVESRPQFIGVYVPQVDQAGHEYGPYANQVKYRKINPCDQKKDTFSIIMYIDTDAAPTCRRKHWATCARITRPEPDKYCASDSGKRSRHVSDGCLSTGIRGRRPDKRRNGFDLEN